MRRLIALALAGSLAAAGCGGEEPQPIDWDLSTARSTSRVDFPNDRLAEGTAELRPDESVRIRLPAARTFTAGDGDVERIALAQTGLRLTEVELVSPPLSLEAGGQRARRWAEQLGLPVQEVDRWLQDVGDGDAAGLRIGGATLGESAGDDLRPTLALTYDAEDAERPVTVAAELDWR